MILAGHQPNYLPNLAFFSKMKESDLFIVATALQMQKNPGWVRRNKILGHHGVLWLTVPVTGSSLSLISGITINNKVKWSRIQQKTLQNIYSNSKGAGFLPLFMDILDQKWNRLVDLNFAYIVLIADILDIKTKIILDEDLTGRRQELIVSACKKYGANQYLTGQGSRDYIDSQYLKDLKKHGIKCNFTTNNLSADYPYSSVHYLLQFGKDWVKDRL